MNHSAIENPKVSLLLQVTMVLNLLLHLYKGFIVSPYEKPTLSLMAIVFLLLTLWELKEDLVMKDLLVGLLLATNVLYFRFISQQGYASLLNNFPYFVISYCLGLLFLYRSIPRFTMVLLVLLALAPFFYVLAVLKLESNGYILSFNRNEIPILLIPLVSLQILNEIRQKRKHIFLLPSIVLLAVSYLTKSRTGLLLSMCIVVMVAINDITLWLCEQRRKNGEFKKKLILVVLSALGIVMLGIYIFYLLWENSRFVTDGFASIEERFHIYVSFLSEMSLRDFLFGFRPQVMSVTHLHNSFFTMISYFGAVSIFYFTLILISLYRYSRTSIILAGLLGIWILHSLVERTSPFLAGDFFIIPLVMLVFPAKRWNRKLITYFFKKKKGSSNE